MKFHGICVQGSQILALLQDQLKACSKNVVRLRPQSSDSVGLVCCPWICISENFPSDVDGTHTLRVNSQ